MTKEQFNEQKWKSGMRVEIRKDRTNTIVLADVEVVDFNRHAIGVLPFSSLNGQDICYFSCEDCTLLNQ